VGFSNATVGLPVDAPRNIRGSPVCCQLICKENVCEIQKQDEFSYFFVILGNDKDEHLRVVDGRPRRKVDCEILYSNS
jgi:hypothetical protein